MDFLVEPDGLTQPRAWKGIIEHKTLGAPGGRTYTQLINETELTDKETRLKPEGPTPMIW